jgi:glycosyltransferase involved in cell wall biosynthesis
MLWRFAEGTPGYDRAAMAAELNVASHIIRESGNIYHFLYGETTYHHVGNLNNFRDNRLVASFHLPPCGLQEAIKIDRHLQQLSAIVCLGRNQQEYFEKIVDHEKVFFAPLGVDIEYYTPPDSFETRSPDLCLFVGDNYRDLPTLRGVIELVSYIRPQTQFVAVTPNRNKNLIGNHPNLTYLTGIPEGEFVNLYRSAALMILPLQDAAANNAVLESMACGLPMVVTDVGATRDYVNSDCAILAPPSDSRYIADATISLLNDCVERKRMAEHARVQSIKFAWPDVVKQLQAVYSYVN